MTIVASRKRGEVVIVRRRGTMTRDSASGRLGLWIPAMLRSTLALAWLGCIAGGLVLLEAYANRAPSVAPAAGVWPAESRLVTRPGCVSVVFFLHPRCSCSTATLNELSRVLTRAPAACTITIAFYAPTSRPAQWGDTALRRQTEALAGVRVVDDVDAREAGLFGSLYSGHVVVYGPEGSLRFSGGITASRGHEGDNLGEDCVLAAMCGREPPAPATPTFGARQSTRL